MCKHPKLLILNTPNNPTGRVFEKEQLQLIADLCQEEKTIAVTDEIYEHIIYDGKHHVSLASLGKRYEANCDGKCSVEDLQCDWVACRLGPRRRRNSQMLCAKSTTTLPSVPQLRSSRL